MTDSFTLPKDFAMTVRGQSLTITGTPTKQAEVEGMMLALALLNDADEETDNAHD